MFLTRRAVPLLMLAGLAMTAAGCGKSNNEGKIVGKWKMVSGPGMGEDDKKMMEAFKIYPYMEFSPDGTMSVGVAAADPKMQDAIAMKMDAEKITCKYKLLSGDGIEFYDLPKNMQEKGGLFGKNKDRARTKVKIDGDNMTMTDDDGQSGTLTRLK